MKPVMARHARLKIAGHPLHLIQRGVNRCACFITDRDRSLYLGLLEEGSRHFSCAIHAYVLMTNHVHLLVTPETSDGASKLMKRVGQIYAQAFNKRHGRTGTLYQGRFRSSIIDSESYLLRCQRYIELNPVRARMVETPRDYRWSSYEINAHGAASSLVTPHPLYLSLGDSRGERLESYARWFGLPVPKDEWEHIRSAALGGLPLGSKEFLDRLRLTLGRRVARGERRPLGRLALRAAAAA